MRALKTTFSILQTLVLALAASAVPALHAAAVTPADWQPGNIVADDVLYNSNTMGLDQIQNFLNSKMPNCDTTGVQSSSHWDSAANRYYTRAEWGAMNGNPKPFVCLRNYVQQNIPAVAADSYCSGNISAGSRTAAMVILDVARACNVNPQALIVLLQKEQGLVTDDWPWTYEYDEATGFGCYDEAATCAASYTGFFNQVYQAAHQFQRYAKEPQNFNFRAGQTVNVQWHPNFYNQTTGQWEDRCGGSTITISNAATAALYNYTPYQPNQAALNAGYGDGDGCSAYGNRNFWLYFSDWFSSTQVPSACSSAETPLPYVERYYNARTYEHFYTAYACDQTFLSSIGYKLEGPVFNTSPCTASYATPVYRYYNPQTGQHMWTTSNETQAQLDAGGSGYHVEAGEVFCVASPGMPGVHPVVRYYNPKTYMHFWAGDPSPSDTQFLSTQAGYTSVEGPVFYTQ